MLRTLKAGGRLSALLGAFALLLAATTAEPSTKKTPPRKKAAKQAVSTAVATHEVTVDESGFKPNVLLVRAGDLIVFRNTGEMAHRVRGAIAGGGEFDKLVVFDRVLVPGESTTITFKWISVHYQDVVNPSQTGNIRVQNAPQAKTSPKGRPKTKTKR